MLQGVLFTAFLVGFCTFFGGTFIFFIKSIKHRTSDAFLSLAAGIMLAATFFSLINPSLELAGNAVWIPCLGLLFGGVLISLFDKLVPHIHNLIGTEKNSSKLDRVMLFVIAIAIHNIPEGMAVGVSFGGGEISNAYSIAIGISIQNVFEGFITILPLVTAGVSKKKAIMIGLVTGLIEVVGVLIGYFTIRYSLPMLPFILSAAGGTMLYVISHEMIPETHSHGYEKTATFSLIGGFILMILINFVFA